MRAWLIIAILTAGALSGCAGEDPEAVDDARPSGDGDSGGEDDGNQTDSGDPNGGQADNAGGPASDPAGNATNGDPRTVEANSAPVPTIAAPADAVVNAPVTVNLSADDPDGDALSWTLALDGEDVANGTALPAAHDHVFAEAGSYRFVFNVTDGALEARANLTLDVVVPEPVLVISGANTVPINPLSGGVPLVSDSNGLGAVSCAGFVAGENEVDCVFGEVPAELAGHVWTSNESATTEFWDSCDATGSVTGGYTHANDGTIPDGTGCAVMWFWGAGTASLHLEVF